MPQTSGTIETQVAQPVEVNYDRLGVPHIKAQNLDDLWFVQGFTTAEDRMFQMDGLRRLAAGTLSEIIGPSTLASDIEARRMRMRRIAQQVWQSRPRPINPLWKLTREALTHTSTLTTDATAPNSLCSATIRQPWTGVDSLLCGLQMFRTLTDNWKTRLVKQQMLRTGDPAKVNYLYPFRSGFELLPGGDAHPGSNAWAISGAHSATGKPLLSNDMHLEFGLPGVWHMDHLEAPGLDVAGVALPGMPGSSRSQRPHRVGRDQSRLQRSGPLHRNVSSPNRPLPFPGEGRAGAPRARDHCD